MLVSDMIEETKRQLLSQAREPMNYLSSTVSPTDTTFQFGRELGGIVPGAYLSVGLEIVMVWDISNTARSATVQRHMLGSTAAAHSNGDLCTINAKFPDFSIMQALNYELTDMSARGVFRVGSVTFTYIPSRRGYNLTGATYVIDQLDARYDYPGPEKSWPLLRNFEIRRNSDTADFASSYQVVLKEGASSGRDVRVTYSTKFNPITSLTQNVVSDIGLPDTATDIPALGAGLRLMSLREGQRNFNEAAPDPRRASEVATGAQQRAAASLQQLHDHRLQTEALRLQKMYPHRRKVL